jgi:hypothetical protein
MVQFHNEEKDRDHDIMHVALSVKMLCGICRDSIHLTCFRIYAWTKFCLFFTSTLPRPCIVYYFQLTFIYWRRRISSIMHALPLLLGIRWAACYAFCSQHLFRILKCWLAHIKKEKKNYHCTYCSWVELDIIIIKYNIWDQYSIKTGGEPKI